jgi:hypothetical protein
MTPKEKADELIAKFKIILMDEDTECGNEILCTLIAKKMASITVFEIIKTTDTNSSFWHRVINEINEL